MRACLALATLIFGLNSFAYASPYEDELARARFLSGQSYFDEGRFGDALNEFREAYRISRVPGFQYNIAVCEEKLGHADAAAVAFERYLREAPMAPDRANVEVHLRALRGRRLTETRPLAKRPWFVGVMAGTAAAVLVGVVVGVVVGTRPGGDATRTLPDLRVQ
jgi:tetratricopeptide (TPR) repeat protein